MEVTETWYLVLSALLFALGFVGVLIRRNPLVMFMCVELMLNAVNISFVAFSGALDDLAGQTAVFFVSGRRRCRGRGRLVDRGRRDAPSASP